MPIHADERPFEIKLTCEEARLDLNLNLDVLGLRMHAAHRDRAWCPLSTSTSTTALATAVPRVLSI